MIDQLTPKFVKHIFVTDIMLLLAIILYNLITLIIPLVRLHLGGIIVFLIVIDVILVIIKLINNYDFSSYR